ncbi:helix-turn-helix domain-containing protein [Moraxella nasicaprae]|uniref:Helix-turn-helix domain-containing protein n=1 Tax=Moraxella nasicaprae TaxID=2904122 RepID=A0ABY6F421_9GAMM|nr:helix-turn-helix transcriptional regulator [Moraxella nasicaprae]UXZ04829.1 helix-turn-helix domain-containing protein [Moraxella nasicaprae]
MEDWEDLTIGQRILAIRGKEPRHSFAKSLDIGTATLQRYESDERQPDIKFLTKLQELTDYSLEYLVHGKEKMMTVGNNRQFHLSNEEQLIIEKYRTANEQVRKQILLMLLADNSEVVTNETKSTTFQNTIHGSVGSQMQAQGDINLNQTPNHGYINQGKHKGDVKFG